MAQRISRAKRTVSGQPFAQPSDVAVVLRVLYLIFNEGYSGRVDLSGEAIRLTRQLRLASDEPEVAGLLALMLLHHARRAARTDEHGTLVPLDKQDRTRWNEAEIAEGVRILQAALARDRRGEYQIQAAHRRAARRRPHRRGNRLAADTRLVQRTPRAHRQSGCRAQPRDRGRRGRRSTSRAERRRGACDAARQPLPARRGACPPARAGRTPRHRRRALHPRGGPGA